MAYIRKDIYYKKAKNQGYRSRAVYKLYEIDNKFNILNKACRILELGAAPGSWSQAILKNLRNGDLLVAIDRLKFSNINNKNFYFINTDIFDKNIIDKIINISNDFDLILSDAAPNTTGDKNVDHYSSVGIVDQVLYLSTKLLNAKGNLICKFFDGSEREAIKRKASDLFRDIHIYKPKSTRKNSFEIYLIGINKN
ncbi:MAG: RlmE family RNA methyltransferase [Deferribacterota bacterium]|nr:RlmE family RNA methyltransferase [Deferribacterota bacterium]